MTDNADWLNKFSMRLPRSMKRGISGLRKRVPVGAEARETIAFLHIGKNAGSQFMRVAEQINAESETVRIARQAHHRRLGSLEPEQRYVFSIRSPISRFRSGFYSRKRKGAPKLYAEWTAHEARAFERFEHANDLAEALFEGGQRGLDALSAIKSIKHCAMDQIGWFDLHGNFLQIRPPITIVRQEKFDADIARFLRLIGFHRPVQLSDDTVLAHQNDYSGIAPLSDKARENLSRWYAQDLEFYRVCEFWLSQQEP